MGRGDPFGAPDPAGARRSGQGRDAEARPHRPQPAGLPRRRLQGADDHRARPRLPVAGPRRLPRPRRARRLQPLALRGRRGRESPRPRAAGHLAPALPPDSRVRAAPHRRGHDRGEGVPPRLQGGAGPAAAGTARQPGQVVEVPPRRPRGPRPLGRLHRGLRRRDLRHHDEVGALVRRSRRSQLGPESRRRRAARTHAGGARSAAAAARAGAVGARDRLGLSR